MRCSTTCYLGTTRKSLHSLLPVARACRFAAPSLSWNSSKSNGARRQYLVGRFGARPPGLVEEPPVETMSAAITEFRIDVSEDQIRDLNARIASVRWPDQLEGVEWGMGAELAFTKELAEYWQAQFMWKTVESKLNSSLKQFVLHNVNSLAQLHYIHHRSARPDAQPLILVHGWPGSFYEFYKVIPMLTNPGPDKPAFHVVAPSLPGFGFSSAPEVPGFGLKAMAKTFNKLMLALGYHTYFAQGGDWGSLIAKAMGMYYPQSCRAVHLNTAFAKPVWWNLLHLAQFVNATYLPKVPLFLTRDEITAHQRVLEFFRTGNAYFGIQSTRPQTLAYAMNDSPVGLMAWIIEKFYFWSDCQGNLENSFTKEELLTNVSIYWFSKRAPSSFRIYYEATNSGDFWEIINGYCSVPTGISVFPVDINAPESWARPRLNLRSFRRMPAGGHFAALERPDLFTPELQRFFGGL